MAKNDNHRGCRHCLNGYHDDCINSHVPEGTECPCDCGDPLTREEVYRLRRMLEVARG